jgi:hypothetical protein
MSQAAAICRHAPLSFRALGADQCSARPNPKWVQERYAARGRPSIDPVIIFKLQLVMFFEGEPSAFFIES